MIEDDIAFQKAVNHEEKLLTLCREKNAHIFHVTLSPDPTYKVFGSAEFGLRAMIPLAGTWKDDSQDIHATFLPSPGELVVRERTGASVSSGSMLDSVLRNNGINTLYLAGFETHICIESTLREAHDRGCNCYVVTDATAAFNTFQQEYFEKEILNHFGKRVTTENILAEVNA